MKGSARMSRGGLQGAGGAGGGGGGSPAAADEPCGAGNTCWHAPHWAAASPTSNGELPKVIQGYLT